MKKDNIKIFISEKSDESMKLLNNFSDRNVIIRRKSFFQKIGVNFESIVSASLVHGTNVEVVGRKNKGDFIKKTDGLVTKEGDVFLTVTVADCLPIFLYNETGEGVGILHGGWRGIVGGLVENGIRKLTELTGCLPENIFLKIGPSIGSCCFEIGESLVEYFDKYQNMIESKKDKKYVDLRRVVQQIALQEGLLEYRINIDCDCTSCLSEKYFSYRRDKPEKVQAMIAGIGIIDNN